MKELFNKIINEEYKVNEYDFFYYFDVSYRFNKYNNDYQIVLNLNVKNSDVLIASFEKDSTSTDSSCNLCNKLNCEHVHALIKKAGEKYQERILSDIDEFNKEKERKEAEKDQLGFIKLFNKISSDINLSDSLEAIETVYVTPVIFNDTLSIKVGRKKKYQVKSIYQFLSMLKAKEKYSYGKELSFIHDINVFDEKGQKLINKLLEIKNINKIVELNKSLLDFVLDLYKDETIVVNNNDTLVRLNEINPKININKSYKIEVNEMNHYKLMLNDSNYILDETNNVIDILSTDNTYNALIVAAINNPKASLKPILDDFKYSVYLRYQDFITIDESIADKFAFDSILIKAFFDYDDKKILLKSEIYKDDMPASFEDLSVNNKKQVAKYMNILTGYGFVENELVDEGDILNFLSSDLSALKKVAEVYLSDTIANKKLMTFTPPSIKVNYANNLMNVFAEESDYTAEELNEILKAIRKKRKFVILKNNVIVTLTPEAEEFANLVDDLDISSKELISSEARIPLYQVFKASAYSKNIKIDDYLNNLINDITNFKNANYELPELNANLRDYQKEAFNWFKTLCNYGFGGILADDMGLGKTLETISVLADSKENKPSLIVCPKSLIFNWRSEFKKFANYIDVVTVFGNTLLRKEIINNIDNNTKKIYITSYDSLRNDIELYENKHFDFIILDEAQFIKNVYALKTKSVKKLVGDHRFVLTGTPIENNIIDLWSIFDFLMPKYLLPLDEFRHKYDVDNNYTNVIFKKISPFVLRRTKKDVLKDLPDKYEVIMSCEMYENQLKLYEAEKQHAKNILALGGKPFDVMFLLTRLRQICVDPSMYVENYLDGSGKIDALLNIVEEHIMDNHRILIFSSFVKALNIISKRLEARGINYKIITGDTKAEDRVNICNEFNNNEDIGVVLISLKAGGTGLNLTGADTVIHLDPWWNVSAQNQATDRAHRIGQVNTVKVIKLICENSIEQRVVELQNIKQELIDKIISNDDSSITSFTSEDLNYILD